VLEVSKSGKSAKCRMTSYINRGASCQTWKQEPTNEPYGDIFTLRIKTDYNGDLILRGSYPYCNDGSMKNKRLGSFDPHAKGSVYYETMSQFGH